MKIRTKSARGTASSRIPLHWGVTLVALSAAAVSLSCAARPAISGIGCDAPPPVEAAIDAVPRISTECGYRVACWREKVAAYRALRNRYPAELGAHRALVTLLANAPSELTERDRLRTGLKDEYSAASQKYPGNPAYPYLLALLDQNHARKKSLLEQSLSRDPTFCWAHEGLARSTRNPTEKERAESVRHFEAFAQKCPGRTTQILSLLSNLESRDAWKAHSVALENSVQPAKPPYENLASLWELEFKFADPSEYPALRAKVGEQVAALRKIEPPPADRKWLAALQTGYKIVGDQEGESWVDDSWLSRFPCTYEATRVVLKRQKKAHGTAPEAAKAKDDWYGQAYSDLKPYLSRCPDEMLLWQVALSDADEWPGASREELESAGERVRALLGARGAGTVADVYLNHNIRLNDIPSLIAANIRSIEDQQRSIQDMGLVGDELRMWSLQHEFQLATNHFLGARLANTKKDIAGARQELKAASECLASAGKIAQASDKPWVASEQAQLWKWTAETDSLAGKDEDALASYRRSLESDPKDEKVIAAARATFLRLGRPEKDFASWQSETERVAAASSDEVTRSVRRPLPDFQLTDVSGKKWSASDLRGKAVALNFWATWCGPCQNELPHFQQLSAEYRGDKDVLFLTVSVDDNPGLIEPFLRENKYTFPALVGGPGSFSKWAPSGIPQTYIVDPSGTIVREQLGFGGDGDRWSKDMKGFLADARGKG